MKTTQLQPDSLLGAKPKFSFRPLIRAFLLMIFLLPALVSRAQQVFYTIDGSKSASNSNYKDFASAFADLDSGKRFDGGTPNGPGISAHVTITVAAGEYAGGVVLYPVPGASALHQIDILGQSNPTNTFIVANKLPAGDSVNPQLKNYTNSGVGIVLLGASHVTFGYMGFKNGNDSNFYTTLIAVFNQSSGLNFVECSLHNYRGYNFYAPSVHDMTIRQCYSYCKSAYANIYLSENYSDDSGQVTIQECSIISDSSSYGITAQFLHNITVTGNQIVDPIGYGGLDFEQCPTITEISYNQIIANQGMGINIFRTYNTPKNPLNIFNNSIVGSAGIGLNDFDNINVYFNSIDVKNEWKVPASWYCGIGVFYKSTSNAHASGLNIANNCIKATHGDAALFIEDSRAVNSMDYNNLYSDSGICIYGAGSSPKLYKKLSDWQSNFFFDAHSISVDPKYNGPTNLLPSETALKVGKNIFSILFDINHNYRNVRNPTIGAYEIPYAQLVDTTVCYGTVSGILPR